MAQDVNNVTVVGNLTRDPELRFTPGGLAVANFGVAWNNRTKNKDTQEWEDDPHFFDVTVWRELAEHVAETFQKGNRVLVNGELRLNTWEKDGEKRSKVEIVANSVGADLQWATAEITKATKGGGGGTSSRPAATSRPAAQPVYDDTDPF